jgi:hypothetical protein
MNYSFAVVLLFLLIAIIFLILFLCLFRLKRIESKYVNLNYDDVQILIEQLKDMLIESERVAEKIEVAVKEKEDLLADLSEILELKLIRMEELVSTYNEENNIKEKVMELSRSNVKPIDIAKKLGISTTEVELMLKFNRERV